MPPWEDKSIAMYHASTVILMLAVAVTATMTIAVSGQLVVTDGDVIREKTFTDISQIDLTYLYESRTVSSTVQFIKCRLLYSDVVLTWFRDPPDTLVTSQYMKWENTIVERVGVISEAPPPNSYTHMYQTQSLKYEDADYHDIFHWRGNFAENTTIRIEDASLHFCPLYFAHKMITNLHTVIHVSGITVQGAGRGNDDTLLRMEAERRTDIADDSLFYFEDSVCVGCGKAIFRWNQPITISRNSALIIRNIINRNPIASQPFFKCDAAITVDETSVFSLVDIDTAREFRASSMPLFDIQSIQGKGVIMFARISMQKSGLNSVQPEVNDNFYVSAKATRSTGDEMTTAQLKEEKFNVNDANAMNWDGTGANGDCVQAGLAVPGRATYTKVNGNCTATCTDANMTALCTKPYDSPCLATNCDICYRKATKRCLVCAPHTTAVADSEDLCECPMSNCLVCPTKDVCTECETNYKPNKEGKCSPCTLPHCLQCPTDDQCTQCSEGYKPSADGKQCLKCGMPNCQQCSADDKCHKCDPDHKPANDGKDCFKCVVDKCLECKEDGTCRTCEDGTPSEDGKQCLKCDMSKCQQCSTDNTCHKCDTDYKPANDGKDCFKCVIDKCLECKVDGTCRTSEDGYKPSEDGKHCYECTIDNCNYCSSDGVCSQCADEYKLSNKNKECIHCTIPHCSECSSDGVCAACDANYKLSPEDGQCYQCTIANCDHCTSDGVCGKCIGEYKLANKNTVCSHCAMTHCTECGADGVCTTCDAPHKPSPIDGKCYECSLPHCNYCTSDGVCGECAEEYKLTNKNKNCFHCIMPHCTECSADGMCMQCAEGYKPSPDRKSCLQCTESKCAICGTKNDCQLCDDDHTLTKKGECISCDLAGCQRCDLGGVCAVCDGAQESVSADGSGCVSCSIGNCTYCSDDGKCAMCACGMVPTNDGSSCVACDVANCVHCDLPGDGHTCAECASGYALSEDGDVCERVSMPPWAVFLIVAFITVGIVVAAYVSMFLYLRHEAKQLEKVTDAAVRRRNRQENYYHHLTEIFVLDIGDIENAASGVRDVNKEIYLKADNGGTKTK